MNYPSTTRRYITAIFLVATATLSLLAGTPAPHSATLKSFKVAPSYFIPNTIPAKREKGKATQLLKDNPGVTAFIQTKKGRVLFTPTGAYIGMRVREQQPPYKTPEQGKALMPDEPGTPEQRETTKTVVMKAGFTSANTKAGQSLAPRLEEQTAAIVNFLTGPRENWHTHLPTYKKLVYDNVWDGISVEYIGYMDRLEYRIHLKAGADPAQIIMESGAETLTVNKNGSMSAELEGGTLTVSAPKAWQEIDGEKIPVDASFQPMDNGRYTFALGSYNPAYPVTIDPVLSWSSFLNDFPGMPASGNDNGRAIAIDSAGAAYVAGTTHSTDFPATSGAFQTGNAGSDDVFVSKLSADGTSLVYSTYLGGSGNDRANSIAIDSTGAVYVTGYTYSTDFPTTSGAFQVGNAGSNDVFVTKLSAGGTSLVYSTYLGGSLDDYGYGIAIDSAGAAYVTGYSKSTDFPVISGAFQAGKAGGDSDGFVSKLSADGTSLVYSTYLGGSVNDGGNGITIDSTGEAYVTGYTHSTDFPATSGAFQISNASNYGYDGFVSKLSADGSSLVYSTYLGGNSDDYGSGIAIDVAGAAYVTGYTRSTDFPATSGAFQASNAGNYYDAFVTKLSADGTSLVYSTYLGGSGDDDRGCGIAIDSAGAAYVTGATNSTDFPTTLGTFQTGKAGGDYDAFITKLSADGTSLVYSTYLGGSGDDEGNGIAVDSAGAAYVTGYTYSSDFPATSDALGPAFGGGVDAFITKVSTDGTALVYSTYFSYRGFATGSDSGQSIAIDGAGAVYVAGNTNSVDFPTTTGVLQTRSSGGQDVFVTKVSADGTSILFSTYIGGSDFDYNSAIAVDSTGAVYLTGRTHSTDFPTSLGAFDTTGGGGYEGYSYLGYDGGDVFVAKVSSDGSAILYSTYLGGSGTESASAIAVDGTGAVYVAGETNSTDFPTTAGAIMPVGGGYYLDAFVTKISSNGSSLLYSTYLGGSDFDTAYAIALDSSGSVYVTGKTDSNDFPVMGGAFDLTSNGSYDAFVAKLNADGSSLLYSTYLGGSGDDVGTAIAVDSAGEAYVTGYTYGEFPITSGAYDTTFNAGYGVDVFVTKLTADGSSLLYSTSLGGSDYDTAFAIAVDSSGVASVTGSTNSADFPTTSGAFQAGNAGDSDAFVTRLSTDGSALLYSTYLGGGSYDSGYGIAVDGSGGVYVTGPTRSADFPVTSGVFGGTLGGNSDAFVTKLDFSGLVSHRITVTVTGNGQVAPGSEEAVEGSDASFTIAPNTGQHIVDVLVDGSSVGAVTSYTFTNVAAGHTLEAQFAPDQFTVTFQAGANGTLIGDTSQVVDYGTACSAVGVSPDPGYYFRSWTGSYNGTDNPLTITNVTSDMTITANFSDQCSISAVASDGGTISPVGHLTVPFGGSQTFTITPDAGYTISHLEVDGSYVSAVTSYTFTNVTRDHTIQPFFSLSRYTVTFTAGTGGSIVGPSPQSVEYGGDCSAVVATASTGYSFTGWTGDYTGGDNPLTITNVTADMSITANFTALAYTLTTTVGTGSGTVDPAGTTAHLYNDQVTLTATPTSGYQFNGWTGDYISNQNPDTITITGDMSVTANFTLIPTITWRRNFGSSSDDYGRSIQQTSDDGYIVAGYTNGFTYGGTDFLIYKLDASGNKQWRRNFGTSSDDKAYAIQQTTDGGYIVAGETSGNTYGGTDFLIYKLDASGNKQWRRNFGSSSDDKAYAIQQTSDGGYIVAGYTNGFTWGGYDFLIYKLDASGNKQWRRNFGSSSDDKAYAIQQTSDGGYIVAGESSGFTWGGTDFAIFKLDENGNKQWRRNFGSSSDDKAYSVQQTADDGYIVAGESSGFTWGGVDFAIFKLDASGNKQWRRNFGSSSDDYGRSIQQTADGGYIIAGYSNGFTWGGYDFLLFKIDSSGTKQWRRNYGSSSDDKAYSVQQTADEGYIVAGESSGFTYGGVDFLLYKLDENGNK